MDFSQVMGAPHFSNGIEFPILSAKDIASLCNQIKDKRVQEAKMLGVELRLPPAELFKSVQAVQAKATTISEFLEWVDTIQGATKVLIESLKKRGMDEGSATAEVEKLKTFDRLGDARFVAGIWEKEEAKKDEQPK